MRYYVFGLVIALTLGIFSAEAMAQESYYIRQNGAKYQQEMNLAVTCDNNIRSVQAQLGNQRASFNRGMLAKDPRVRNRVKNEFMAYLRRLINVYLDAEKAYSRALYYGEKYAAGLLQLSSRAAQGRQVSAQLVGVRNNHRDRYNTRQGLEREFQEASKRY